MGQKHWCYFVVCLSVTDDHICPYLQCNESHTVCVHENGGKAKCVCEPGFVDNGNGKCVNEDNCRDHRCQYGATCLDSVNTYVCIADWGSEGRYVHSCLA